MGTPIWVQISQKKKKERKKTIGYEEKKKHKNKKQKTRGKNLHSLLFVERDRVVFLQSSVVKAAVSRWWENQGRRRTPKRKEGKNDCSERKKEKIEHTTHTKKKTSTNTYRRVWKVLWKTDNNQLQMCSDNMHSEEGESTEWKFV